MKTFLSLFNIFPAVLGAVVAVEAAIPTSGAGQQKLNLVLGAALAAWEASQEQQKLSKNVTLNAVNALTMLTVSSLNAAGVFKSGETISNTPVSSK